MGREGGVCGRVVTRQGWSLERIQSWAGRWGWFYGNLRRWQHWLGRGGSKLDDGRRHRGLCWLRGQLLAVVCDAGPPVHHPLCWVLHLDGLEELSSILQRREGEGGVQA